jgi:hypothetical protein
MNRMPRFFLAGAVLCAFVVSGCSHQQTQAADAGFQHGVAVANQKVDQEVKESKPKLSALELGARVTTALQVNQNLPHDSIRVDASPTGVRLRGTVTTKRQKLLATQVAKDTLGPGKTVDDELTVKGS